jgi:hypothetical protein
VISWSQGVFVLFWVLGFRVYFLILLGWNESIRFMIPDNPNCQPNLERIFKSFQFSEEENYIHKHRNKMHAALLIWDSPIVTRLKKQSVSCVLCCWGAIPFRHGHCWVYWCWWE